MADKRDHNVSNIRARLQKSPTPVPGSNPALDQPAEVVEPVPMRLTLDQLLAYDRNPRHTANAKYAELRASIRALGLLQPLAVTRRPTDPPGRYMVAHGGNTRLEILRDLYQETGESRFSELHVLVVPWVSEIHIYAAHLAENEEEHRAPLLMIDKALALVELRALIDADAGEPLSQRAFIEQLNALGLESISQRHYARLEYVHTLSELLPAALRTGDGLSVRDIDALRALEKLYREAWIGADRLSEGFNVLWAEVLSGYDDELEGDFDLQGFESALVVRMATDLDVYVGQLEDMAATVLDQRARSKRSTAQIEPAARPLPAPAPEPAAAAALPTPLLPFLPDGAAIGTGDAPPPAPIVAPWTFAETDEADAGPSAPRTPGAAPAGAAPAPVRPDFDPLALPAAPRPDTPPFLLPTNLRERLDQAHLDLHASVMDGSGIDQPLAELGRLAFDPIEGPSCRALACGYVAAKIARIAAMCAGLPDGCVIEDSRSPAGFWVELPCVASGKRAAADFAPAALRATGLPIALEWPVHIGERGALDPALEMQRNWWWYLYGLAGAAIPDYLSSAADGRAAQVLTKLGSLQLYRACYLFSPYGAHAYWRSFDRPAMRAGDSQFNAVLDQQLAATEAAATAGEIAVRAVDHLFSAAVGGPSLVGMPLWLSTLLADDFSFMSLLAALVHEHAQ